MRGTPPRAPRRVRGLQDSKSAAVRAAAAAPSRRQLSHWQREQRQRRGLYLAAGGLVLLVALIFGGGLFYENVVRANETVALVGGETITGNQLLEEVKPNARGIEVQARQRGSSGPGVAQYVEGQKRELIDPALSDLIDATIIRQEADRRGISVAPSEVDERLQQAVASYAAATNPTPAAAVEASPTAKASPAVGGTPTPRPTLEPAEYDANLKKALEQVGLTEQDERKQLARGTLREKVQPAVGEERVPANQEQVHARQIVVASEDQAREVLGQLQGGADFADLAQQVSTESATKAKGGDLGWFPRGVNPKTIEDTAFALQPGQLSDVVAAADGSHVIQVLEREANRPVEPDQLTTLRSQAFTTWLAEKRATSDVRISFSPSERNWVLSKIGVRP